MAAQLSLASAKVTGPEGVVASRAQVLVRANVLKVTVDHKTTAHPDVLTVTQESRGVWIVRFPGAVELRIERTGGACDSCRGRR